MHLFKGLDLINLMHLDYGYFEKIKKQKIKTIAQNFLTCDIARDNAILGLLT